MRFFRLTHPRYADDHEEAARNPVRTTYSHCIPGIICEVCSHWSASDRLRMPLPTHAEEFSAVRFLTPVEWNAARPRWASFLGVDVALVRPGMSLGLPSGERTGAITEDAVHPMPGEIWVTPRVREALREFVGVSFAPVTLSPPDPTAILSELVVHGRAWRVDSSEATLRMCERCGRRGFPSHENREVDVARWDGADFVFLDHNPNIVFVTERVAELVNSGAFSNLVAEPS